LPAATSNPAPLLADALPSPLLVTPAPIQPPSLTLKPLPPCSTQLARCRLPRANNPFKFDDRSMSNAPYDAIAHSHRFELPNWLDPNGFFASFSFNLCSLSCTDVC
jgi:hypothetical protein